MASRTLDSRSLFRFVVLSTSSRGGTIERKVSSFEDLASAETRANEMSSLSYDSTVIDISQSPVLYSAAAATS